MRYISGLHRWLAPVGIRLSRKLRFPIPDAMEHYEIIGSTLPSFLSMHPEAENPNRIAIYFPACAQDVRGNVSPVAPLDYFKIRGLLNLPFYFIMLRVTLGLIALCKIEWTESTKSRYRLTSLEGSLRQSFDALASCRRSTAEYVTAMSPLPTIVIVSLIPIYTAWSALSWSLTYRLYHVTLDYKSCICLEISRLRRALSDSTGRVVWRRNIFAGYSKSVSMSLVLSPSTSWTSFTIPQGRWICDKWCTYDFPQLVCARVNARHTIARSFKLLMLTNEDSRGWHYWPSGRGQLDILYYFGVLSIDR